MSLIFLNFLLAAVPALLLMIFFYRRDSLKHEPPRLLLKAFIFGFIALIPALILEIIISRLGLGLGRISSAFFHAFIVSGAVEEGVKVLFVYLIFFPDPHFDEVSDGIVYTAAVSLGLAFFENLFYSTGSSMTIIIRGLTAVPLHAGASAIMGYYLGLYKMGHIPGFGTGLLLAILIHGLYNFFLFIGGYFSLLIFPLLIVTIFLVFRFIKKAREIDRGEGSPLPHNKS